MADPAQKPGSQSVRTGAPPDGRRRPPPPPPGPIARVPSAAFARPPLPTPPESPTLDRRNGFGLPNLRRNVCPHFYMTGTRGAIPIQAPHLLKGLMRQENTVSRCQVRGGVHLEQGYVSDICLSSRFNQCVFYEDELGRH